MFNKLKGFEEQHPLLYNFTLLLTGAILFALSFPSFIYRWGFGALAWIALVPIFILIRRISLKKSLLYGFLYGYISYMLFNFWLYTFNPTSFVFVPFNYGTYLLICIFFMTWADKRFPKWGYLLSVFFWLGYEYYRTTGYLGYSYGVIGYSQYKFLGLIGIADITGVLGVSALVVFCSALIAKILITMKEENSQLKETLQFNFIKIPGILFVLLFTTSLIYSHVNRVDYSHSPTVKASLVQHNVNSWLSGTEVYAKALDKLIDLSEEALDENPDFVVWSETAFVPSIKWHNHKRQDRSRLALIKRLEAFLQQSDVPFIIGNNDTVTEAGEQVSYNAALLMEGKEIKETYRKIHLAPFGEHFPYEKIFPRFYKYILDNGATFYKPGTKSTYFEIAGAKVSPQICFEDTFGDLSKNSVQEGGDILVNLTNDSWSPAPACSIQHGSIAVFRAIENRRSMIRASNGGLTVQIDPNGKMLNYLPPFKAAVLTVDVPVYNDRETFYTRTNLVMDHIVAYGSLFFIGLLIFLSIRDFFKRRKS